MEMVIRDVGHHIVNLTRGLLFLAVGVSCLALPLGCMGSVPNKEDMKNYLEERRDAFESINSSLLKARSQGLESASIRLDGIDADSAKGLHENDARSIRKLMRQAGIESVTLWPNAVVYDTWTFGLGVSGASGGYVYSTEPLSDDAYVTRIEDDWYIFKETH